VGIWSDHLKQAKQPSESSKKKTDRSRQKVSLPLIIPMVFYHGPGPYTGPRHIRSLIEGPSELVEQFFGPLHLIDTHDLADADLREQRWAGIMTFVMKHIYVRDMAVLLKPLIELLQRLACESDATEYKATLLHYLINTGDTAEPAVFVQAIEEGLSASKGEGVMTIASRLIDIGVQQGVKQERRRGEFHFLLSLLERKFGPISVVYRERIKQASSEQLLCWGAKLLEVNSLEDLFEEALSTTAP
jgi:Putative transposase, YhgA-like/Domain of unknown function (DUF4351)